MNGADLDVGHCLELIAGEFIATYAHRAYQFEETECGEGTLAEEQQQDVAIRAGARRLPDGLRHWAGGG